MAVGVFEVTRRWLQAQGLVSGGSLVSYKTSGQRFRAAPTLVVFVVAPSNALLTYLLVWSPSFGMGFVGAPL
jgi:Na+-driven multidrug efflux pump